ncbi:MAG: hypothetical protein ACXU7X_00925, partial [Croceibacterium sp.]
MRDERALIDRLEASAHKGPAPVRPGSAGVREVLGFPISGSSATADVRALLLGTRIDTRNLPRFVEPEYLELSGTGA